MGTRNIKMLRQHILDRILLLAGSAGLLLDGIAMNVFSGDTGEIIWLRLGLIVLSGTILGLSLFVPAVQRNLYPLVSGFLFAFILEVAYLNYVHRFGFEYVLVLHVGVIVSSIYFRQFWLLLSYLGFAYLIVVVASLSAADHFVPPRLLLARMVLTMGCGYGLNMLNRDIQRRLRSSNRRFRMLAENSTDLIALHDGSGRIEYVNPAARAMLGYSEEELKGKSAFSLIHPEDREAASKAYYEQLFLQGKTVQLEYRLLCKDNTPIWVEAVGTPLGKEGRQSMRIITTSRDASKRKRVEEESRRFQEKLLRINKELDQFAYIVSHDLKAPLRGVSNLANFIEEDLEELLAQLPSEKSRQGREELGKHLALMRRRIEQMEEFIEDVLSFSRAGRVAKDWEEVNLNDLLDQVVANLALPPEFRVKIPEVIPPVMGARVHFEQIFYNLISNAWKHHHLGTGMVRVEYRDAGDFHRLTVTDDGPGIPEKFHDRIFEVFQQLQPSDEKGGTGVGLAIVRKIINHAGGTIEVGSGPEGGTVFNILWPKNQINRTDN